MKGIYFDSNLKENCNGCGTCELVCPVGAIKMIEDNEGFLYPEIDEKKCIKCNKCKNMCSNNPGYNEYNIQVYATKNKNISDRLKSTSGGMFYILAQYVIERNGVVFGVRYGKNLKVMHDYSENLDGCRSFSVSKYVRSDLKNSYLKVKEFLKNDRYVLFTGTPCQVYGLKKYLNKNYEKLILCEIICHANPSPKLFDMYIKNIEKENNKKVKNMYFRSKEKDMKFGPYIEFEDGTKKINDSFNKAFLEQLINRPSCNSCQFVTKNRKSDFTIGDFWGADKIFKEFYDNNGISLLTVNSPKAKKIFDEIKTKLEYIETDLDTAFKYNHYKNLKVNKKRKLLFDKIAKKEIDETNIIAYMNKYTKKTFYKRVVTKIKKIIKNILRRN